MSAARDPSTMIEIIVRSSSGNAECKISTSLGSTVRELKEELTRRKMIAANNTKAKLVFAGRFVTDDENLMKLLENYDVTIPHTMHLIGGISPSPPTNPPPSSASQSTTSSTTTAPTPQQIQLLQQQLLMQQMLLAGTPPFDTPTNTYTTSTTPSSANSPPVNPIQQQILLQQMQRLQQLQSQMAQLRQLQQQQLQAQTQQAQSPPNHVNDAVPRLDADQEPQRLIEEQPRNQIVINIRIGPLLTTIFRIALLCIILFPRQGWATWLKFTLLFTGIFLGFQYGAQIRELLYGRGQQNQHGDGHEQQGAVNGNQQENDVNAQAPPTNEAPNQISRGPLGTLFHIIYLFFVSLSPTYQPRGYVIPPEDAHEHED